MVEPIIIEVEGLPGGVNSRLTPKGVEQAKTIAEKLREKKFQMAFKTNLSRSSDSLRIVLKHHPECRRIIVDDRMIERSYGDLEKKYHKTVIKTFGKRQFNLWHRSYDVPPPEGESIKMIEDRVVPFINDLVTLIRSERASAVISVHRNSMRPFRRYFENLAIDQMMELENLHDEYFDYTVKYQFSAKI